MPESADGVERTHYKTEEIQVNGKRCKIEFDREEDGKFIAEAVDIPGAMAYGDTEEEALQAVKGLIQEAIDLGTLVY